MWRGRESGFQVGASQLLDVAADLSSTFGQSFSMRAFTGTPEKTRPGHGSRQAKAGAAASQADAGGAAAGTNAFAVSLNNVQVWHHTPSPCTRVQRLGTRREAGH